MGSAQRQQRELFDRPAAYRIQVLGWVTDDVAGRVLSLGLAVVLSEAERPISILEGELRDQSALAGVLDMLYELHLPILSVERLAERPTYADTSQ